MGIISLILQKNQEWFVAFLVMSATVCHWHLQQTEQRCYPLPLPWPDCGIRSEHKGFPAHTYNTAQQICMYTQREINTKKKTEKERKKEKMKSE